MTIIDSVRSYIPKPVQNVVNSTITWGKAPIGDTRVYQGISNLTGKGLTKVAEKATEVAAKNVAAEGFMARCAGKIAGYIAPAAKSTEGFIGKMGTVAKSGNVLFSKANIALAALFESTDIIEGFKEGRGLDQTVQSATKVGAGVAGSAAAIVGAGLLLGTNPIGWAALAIGAVGGAIGYIAGDKATSFLGHNKKGLFESEQVAVAPTAQPAAGQFGKMTMPNGSIAPIPFDLNNPRQGLEFLAPPVYSNYRR